MNPSMENIEGFIVYRLFATLFGLVSLFINKFI